MKKILLCIFLLLIPLASAQHEHEYSIADSLDIEVTINESVSITPQSSDAFINQFETQLTYLPVETARQTIKSFEPKANGANISKGEVITYTWTNPPVADLSYSLSGVITTSNNYKKVTKKIPYPTTEIPADVQPYLQPSEFITINDPIRNQAQRIVDGEDDYYEAVYTLADWVHDNVHYSLTTLTADAVQPSSWVYENRVGVCDEITNLFISMCRSVGIPARFVSGTVYTNTNDAFGNHGWAEVWFPEYGWVPVDVTFGQYGWIDPTHVKLKHSLDSGDAAVNFNWRAKDIQVEPQSLSVNANVIKVNGQLPAVVTPYLTMEEDTTGFDSYLPAHVTLKNPDDYYMPLQVHLTKAPGVYNNISSINVLLKPGEEKTVTFIIHTPTNLDTTSRYLTTIAVETSYGTQAETSLTISPDAPAHSQEEALKDQEQMSERKDKEELAINVQCDAPKKSYYTGETLSLTCTLSSRETLNVRTCLNVECHSETISAVPRTLSLSTTLTDIRRPLLTFETDSAIKYYPLTIEIAKAPQLYLRNINPESMNYKDKKTLSFTAFTDGAITDVHIKLKSIGTITIDRLQEKTVVNVPLKGSQIRNDMIPVTLTYKDTNGKEYTSQTTIPITVTNRPWYAFVTDFRNMF